MVSVGDVEKVLERWHQVVSEVQHQAQRRFLEQEKNNLKLE
jgi:hypothetical protein